MKEKLRGNTRVIAARIEASKVNGSLTKAFEAETAPATGNDLPLVRALEGRSPYAVVKIGGKLTTVIIL